ncbi:MAG TPA: SDR family oxidoreductase [Sphingomonas sp.]|jgi:NAD(P)-dependent dehydrogenase (short-subunit alcohol dehydrogenase family)|nr:SDR family oxidoreductase [Sphingomonas sp.]
MKLALVTGGYRRIGAAIAAALARDGWTLALHSHHAAEPNAELAATLGDWRGVVADLGDAAAVEALVPQVESAFGQPISLLVNCASLFADDDAQTASAASLLRFHAVNALAPQALALAAARRGGDGAVVNILDQRVRNPVPDQLSYSLSKTALAAATRTLAVALAPRWRVNAVAPGLTLPSPAHDETVLSRARELMPLKLLPSPQDIADAVRYFASAKSVTGQTLFVDGGASLRGFERDFGNL